MKKGRKKINGDMRDAEFAEEGVVGRIAKIGGGFREIAQRAQSLIDTAKDFAVKHRVLLIRAVLPALYCLLFGGAESHMGTYPFGISAVCAATAGANSLLAAAATIVSSLLVRGGFYITAVSAATAGLLLLINKLKGETAAESTVLRAIISMAAGAVQTLLFFLPGGIGFYGLCAVLLSAVICPVLTVALKGLFTSSEKLTPTAEAGVYALIYTVTYFLRMLSPGGASAATAISALGVLFASYLFGIGKSVMVGVAVGLAAAPEYSFIYGVAAVGSGVLMGISPIAAVLGGVMLALSFGIYSGGAYAFGDLFPELMFSAAVAAPLFHYGVIPRMKKETVPSTDSHAEIISAKLAQTKGRLAAVSDSLGVISTVMKKLSGVALRPSAEDIRQMCDRAFDESCQYCHDRRLCWDREYRETASAIDNMASAVKGGRTVDRGYLTEGMRQRCGYTDPILSRINGGAISALRATPDMAEERLAADYGMMSELVGEIAKGTDDDLEYDAEATDALKTRFDRIGVRVKKLLVYGKRHRRVIAHGLEKGCTAGNEEIRAAAADVLGCSMSSPEYRIDGRHIVMNLHTAAKFSVGLGKCSVAKRGERCGDSITSFKGEGGFFYTLISDGMGSGSEASLTSSVSAVFLERMLCAGAPLASSMEMLNSFLDRRAGECFTTVDLMAVDLITGELKFVKSGAAPSFVLRDGRLFRIASKTVPVGIVTPFDAEQISFMAKEGDIVIMLSDGAIPDGEDSPWLYDILCGDGGIFARGADPDSAAREIADRAAGEYGFTDDVTVGIVEIRKAKEA